MALMVALVALGRPVALAGTPRRGEAPVQLYPVRLLRVEEVVEPPPRVGRLWTPVPAAPPDSLAFILVAEVVPQLGRPQPEQLDASVFGAGKESN